ncbi:MAG: class I SAM-dependent methyltransferase [Thermodesulfobacteriota bacterium]
MGQEPAPAEQELDTAKQRLKFANLVYLAGALREECLRRGKGLRVLDVGCGPGNLAHFSGLDSCRWFGLDLWEHQLRQAAEKGRYEQLFQVNLVRGLPFRSEWFDLVVCNEVLMYLPNATEILHEFNRILRPEGKVFVYNPISWIPAAAGRVRRWVRKIYQEDRTVSLDTQTDWKSAQRACRITYYSCKSMKEVVAAAGFEVVGVTGFRLFRNRIRLMARLEAFPWYRATTGFLASRYPFLASDVLITARKADGHTTNL